MSAADVDSGTDRKLLHSVARTARLSLEAVLNSSDLPVAGTCLIGAYLTHFVFTRFWLSGGADRSLEIQGGGDGDGGILVNGTWRGHYWVVATARGDSYIIDISADQFGMPPCIVRAVSDEPTIYAHGSNTDIDVHLAILVEMGVIPQL